MEWMENSYAPGQEPESQPARRVRAFVGPRLVEPPTVVSTLPLHVAPTSPRSPPLEPTVVTRAPLLPENQEPIPPEFPFGQEPEEAPPVEEAKEKEKEDAAPSNSEDILCVVCENKLPAGESPPKLTDDCTHYVCGECIVGCHKAGKTACPYCRRPWVVEWMILDSHAGNPGELYVVPTYGRATPARGYAIVITRDSGVCQHMQISQMKPNNRKHVQLLGAKRKRTFERAIAKLEGFTAFPVSDNVCVFLRLDKKTSPTMIIPASTTEVNVVLYALDTGSSKYHIDKRGFVTRVGGNGILLGNLRVIMKVMEDNGLLKFSQ